MKRRDIIKGLTLLPFAGSTSAAVLNTKGPVNKNGFAFLSGVSKTPDAELAERGRKILKSIGVEPFVNCKGTNTIMGGSVARPEVRLAMDAVATLNVQMDELVDGVGKRLAELTGAEWGLVTSGAAAGIKLCTIACITGGNPEKLIRIPDLTGFEKTEVIIPGGSRTVYDQAVRSTGVKIITVENEEDLKKKIGPRTAMIYIDAEKESFLPLEIISKIARPLNVPVFVDAAAHILTFPNVHLSRGADVVAFSGGKGLKAPGSCGLLLGRKDLLMSTWQAAAPHHGPGRDNKVSREEHIGMLAAVETWVQMDHKKEMQTWVNWLEYIGTQAATVKGVSFRIRMPDPKLVHHVTPYLFITWDPDKLHVSGQEISEELGNTYPRVGVAIYRDEPGLTGISLVGYMMVPGDDQLAASRIREVLSKQRSPKASIPMKSPVTNMLGRWDMEVQFYNSREKQELFIDSQEGNYFSGTYKSQFSERIINGTIDGDVVKMQSIWVVPGDRIQTTFQGSVSGETLSGDIDMNEFLSAKFNAKRKQSVILKKPVAFPKGRPQGGNFLI
ncbi:Seryl-tRNA(Sec) selenium transferase [Daejeonella rubra]|uniref:Seryl-tRNA(Sec) selenium transferase n=1 Tax=Daejeonella rubra TaxID=990371 RepID=A0A1G9TIL6_9SPHI|nr:aminotransferase class V-fold PLP-dependent enzyme [Daejeonella rubra]SDM47587.1 Seryl-tRNA(Sec) selenium transferase [Daejeonella rubra]